MQRPYSDISGVPTKSAINLAAAHKSGTPPMSPPCFDATPESILLDAKSLIEASNLVQDAIVEAVKPEAATFTNTILPLVHQENKMLHQRQLIEFYSYVSPSEEIMHAARRARDMFAELDTRTSTRHDLYSLIIAVHARFQSLDTESQRLVDTMLSQCTRQGLGMRSEDRVRLQEIDSELRQIGDDYLDDLQRPRYIDLQGRRDGLEGVPQKLLSSLRDTANEPNGCLRLKIVGRTQLFDLLSHLDNHKMREKIYREFTDQHYSNAALLERATVLRSEKAQLLGFNSYAEWSMSSKMERDPKVIERLLSEFSGIVEPSRASIVRKWKHTKQEDLRSAGEPASDQGGFYLWDRPYYTRLMMKRDFAFEAEGLADYFPLEYTVSRMLGIFGHLFGLSFVNMREHTGSHSTTATVADKSMWNEDVILFAVWDSSESSHETTEFSGYLYMDLYARDGKRPGFSDLPIRPVRINAHHPTAQETADLEQGFTSEDGSRFCPSTCLLCDFEKPAKDKPCLLRHEQVVLLFHELGHGIHDIVAKTKFARFHGASTAADFNEAPSQMLENWCWLPTTLGLLGKFHGNLRPEEREVRQLDPYGEMAGNLDTTSRLSDDLMERLANSKRAKDMLQCLALLSISSFELSVNGITSPSEAASQSTTARFHAALETTFGFDIPPSPPPSQAIEAYHFTIDGIYIYLTYATNSREMPRNCHQQLTDNPLHAGHKSTPRTCSTQRSQKIPWTAPKAFGIAKPCSKKGVARTRWLSCRPSSAGDLTQTL